MQFKQTSISLLFASRALAQTPPGFSPSTNVSLSVNFNDITISRGTEVPPADAASSPALSFGSTSSDASHIVMMVDLDAGNSTHPHAYSPLLHWATFVPSGEDTLPSNSSTMSDIAFYFGPAPPSGSGPHRYLVLLLESQNTTFELPPTFKAFNSSNIPDRFVFGVETFATEGGLELVAANWFTSENKTSPPVTTNAASSRGGFGSIIAVAGVLASFLSYVI